MNIIDKIEQSHFVATDAQVENLAADMYTANSRVSAIDGVYLRVLIAGCQAKLGVGKRGPKKKNTGDIDAQMAVLESVHDRFYAAVLRGVTTADIAQDASQDPGERQRRSLERNRRSTFARTAKSTLAAYVNAGGDLRGVDVGKATKGSLRAFAKPATVTPGAQLARSHTAFINAATKCAKDTPEEARAMLERSIAELRQILQTLDEPPATAALAPLSQRRAARTVAGAPFVMGR